VGTFYTEEVFEYTNRICCTDIFVWSKLEIWPQNINIWGGFVSVELKNRISAFFKRLRRFGYTNCVITIDDLIHRSDYELFRKVCSETHSLHHLLPPYRTSDLHLRGSFSAP